jgi:hypothetical protein
MGSVEGRAQRWVAMLGSRETRLELEWRALGTGGERSVRRFLRGVVVGRRGMQ